MTRINVIDPRRLTDQHLLAEYRELPRVFGLARAGADRPSDYVLGAGHVLFFYPLTGWLSVRHAALVRECRARGFEVQHRHPLDPVPGLDGDWTPTPKARALNLHRLRERLLARPNLYRYCGRPVGLDFYNEPQDYV